MRKKSVNHKMNCSSGVDICLHSRFSLSAIFKSLVPPKVKLFATPSSSPQYEPHLEAAGKKALKESFRSCDWNEKPIPGLKFAVIRHLVDSVVRK